jgi:hypothetical protein
LCLSVCLWKRMGERKKIRVNNNNNNNNNNHKCKVYAYGK